MTLEQKALYDFLSVETNFDNGLLVMEYMPKLREQLLRGFWGEVEVLVTNWIKREGKEWRLGVIPSTDRWWSLNLSKSKWHGKRDSWELAISWSDLAYIPVLGVWLREDTQYYNYAGMREAISGLNQEISDRYSLLLLAESKYPNWWPLMWDVDNDFSTVRGIRVLIPSLRDQKAAEFAEWMIRLADAVEVKLDSFVEQYKK